MAFTWPRAFPWVLPGSSNDFRDRPILPFEKGACRHSPRHFGTTGGRHLPIQPGKPPRRKHSLTGLNALSTPNGYFRSSQTHRHSPIQALLPGTKGLHPAPTHPQGRSGTKGIQRRRPGPDSSHLGVSSKGLQAQGGLSKGSGKAKKPQSLKSPAGIDLPPFSVSIRN